MGIRGPQSESNEVRARKGYPGGRGKNPIKPKKSSGALAKLPPSPRHLRNEARIEWKRAGKVLVESGKLSKENIKLFEGYCHSYEIFCQAQKKLEDEELTIFVGKAQDEKPNPLIAIARDAQNMMLKMLRAIQTSTTLAPDSKQDPLENFLKRAEKLKVVKK